MIGFMTSQGSTRQPKYQRIADALRTAIQAGEYGPGDRLPGENDLMATYEVARMTARQALGVLQNEGIAEARKGAGVFVRAFKPLRRRGIQRLAHEQWGAGRSIWSDDAGDRELVVDQIEVREVEADNRISSALGLPSGAQVWARSRRFVLDGKPVLFATSYLPSDVVGTLPSHRWTPARAGRTPDWQNWVMVPFISVRKSGPGCPRPTRPRGSCSPWAHRSSRSSALPSPKAAGVLRSTK